MAKRPEAKTIPRAVDLIEEAVHLLRAHPGALGLYYAGAAPFACGVVFFWAYVSWFVPSDGAIALGALGLALAFGVMRTAQHRYAQNLRAHLTGDALPRWRTRDWTRECAAQFRLQAPGVVVLPLAAGFGVPFGWAYAYFQSAAVLPSGDGASAAERRRAAWEQAMLWPAQNHWALAILSILWSMVFLNVAVAFVVVPMLATRWLGLHTVFALSGWSYFNTTFLAVIAALTHLAVGPLIKAFYVVRVFRGEARRSGADLLLVLRREQARRTAARAGIAALVFATLWLGGVPTARAADVSPTPTVALEPRQLDRALDEVLARPDFRWRLRPPPEAAEARRKKEGIVMGFLRATFETAREVVRSVSRWLDGAKRWLADLLPGGKDDKTPARSRDGTASLRWMDVLQFGAYALLAIVAGLLLWVVWKVFEHNRTRPLAGGAAGALPTAAPDLRDENVEASRLPAHEWLALARAKLAEGEWRLAWRALFLATIATHAHDGLLSLAKFKTNLDYERELRRRALGRSGVAEDFRARREAFEAVWYGHEPANAEAARDWLRQLEAPR
ncbi:MAG: hypothetical protein HZA32_19550 [Opitutae bacterium]|nr:hypothetical protein [Opitutae bacterium]